MTLQVIALWTGAVLFVALSAAVMVWMERRRALRRRALRGWWHEQARRGRWTTEAWRSACQSSLTKSKARRENRG